MPKIARHLDTTDHGGYVIASPTRTYVNNKLVIVLGDIHVCPLHGNNPMVEASSNIFVENIRVCRLGDHSACGAVISSASDDTFGNG